MLTPRKQLTPFQSPWPFSTQVILIIWRIAWLLLCRWTPKFLNPWRLLILIIFGARISGLPFVHSSAKIQMPWHLTMRNRACIGEKANAYNLAEIEILEDATIAQEVYLCTGTHDFNCPALQLITETITIQRNAFIGARAMILPGVTVEQNAIIGAMSVVTKNVKENSIVAGNPAQNIGERPSS